MKYFLRRELRSVGHKLTTERVFLLTGFEDTQGREVRGIFEIFIAPELIREQMERAVKNKSKQSWDGPVVVFYRPATSDQAELLIEQLQRAESPAQRKTEASA